MSCDAFGLSINLKQKPVIMFQPAPGKIYVEPDIYLKTNRLKVVDSFVYLGSTLYRNGFLDVEITNLTENS